MTRETAKQLINVIEQELCEKQHGIAKHWKLIKAFADGANIQIETYSGWVDVEDPDFQEYFHYRVKPATTRWRADYDECYWRVKLLSSFPCNVYEDKDYQHGIHDRCYEMGNYFKTEKDAQLVADCINKIFKLIRDGVPASEIEVKQIERITKQLTTNKQL